MYHWVDEFVNVLMFWGAPVLPWKRVPVNMYICLYRPMFSSSACTKGKKRRLSGGSEHMQYPDLDL